MADLYGNAPMRDRLIVGLDVSDRSQAERIVAALGQTVAFYKIGYQLGFAGGLELARDLLTEGKRVFLDFKLHDIGNTVANGIAAIAAMGVTMTTVHATPQVMRAAATGAAGSGLVVLGVTVLTSLDDADLAAEGYRLNTGDLAAARARDAVEAGIGGLVASPAEAAAIRAIVGSDRAIVTPGIRPAGSDKGDQKRVATPAEALRSGATHLVVARPIIAAADPQAAAAAIVAEMEGA